MTRGKKALYQVEQVAKEVAHLSKLFTQKIEQNPVLFPTLGTEFFEVLSDMDIQQTTASQVWDGMPDNLPGWAIEHMLYYRSSLVGFFIGDELFVTPYTQTQGINILGFPIAVKPVTYNGASNEPGKVGDELAYGTFYPLTPGGGMLVKNGKETHTANAAILYDRLPTYGTNGGVIPSALLVKAIIEAECDLLGRIKINIANANKKLLFRVRDEGQARSMRQILRGLYTDDSPFEVVTDEGMDNLRNDVLQTDVELQTQALFEAFQSYNSIRCMVRGINNNGAFEKKERKITGELESSAQTSIILEQKNAMRKLWLNQLRLIAPTPKARAVVEKMSVVSNPALIEEIDMKEDKDNENEDNN